MRSIRTSFPLMVLLFLAGCGTPAADQGVQPQATYAPLTGEVPNPERGFFADSYYPDDPLLDVEAELGEARAQGFEPRLIRRTYYLEAFLQADDLSSFLPTLEADLQAARQAGVKLILRFAYRPRENAGEAGDLCDPPKERILGHLAQLGPVLQAHRGVVAYLEAGLIGPWGEWHSASPVPGLMDPLPGYSDEGQPPCGVQNYDRKLPNPDTLDLVRALLEALPGRYVAVRYPMAKAKLLELSSGGPRGTYPPPEAFSPLTPEEVGGTTLKARLAAHNDCVLASPDDYGTFYYTPGTQQDREKAYWQADTLYVPMGGETCTPGPYVPPGKDPRSHVLETLAGYHFQALNLSYHPGFIAWLRSQGLLEEVKARLGYRFHLQKANYTLFYDAAGQPQQVQLRLWLENQGFGRMYNPKRLSLVFLRKDGYREERLLDERFFGPNPGQSLLYTYTALAPSRRGEYRLYLRLLDPDLPEDPRYAVRLASRLAFQEGMNDLGLRLRF